MNPTSVGFRWGTTSAYGNERTCSIGGDGTFTTTLTGLTPDTQYHWTAFAEVEGKEYTLANDRTFTTDEDLEVEVKAHEATNKTTSSAHLSASYSIVHNGVSKTPDKVGFCWSTASTNINRESESANTVVVSASNGSFAHTLTGLSADTAYHWRAWVEYNGKTKYSTGTNTFTTESTESTTPALGKSWLEMPAEMTGYEATMATNSTANLFTHTFYYTSTARNYTVCYDKSAMTTLWVAYPLGNEHLGTGRSNDWAYVDSSLLPTSCQANVKAGSFYSASGTNNYDRGHLVPSGSRNKSLEDINKQTFLPVNIAPQNATFNQKTWENLESALQSLASGGNYLYIVTGTMCKQASDGNGSFSLERTYDKDGKEIPVPKYFYKVILKVNSTSASAIGFWFTNTTHSDSYTNYVRSVDEIEALTGLNFFVNLKDELEVSAEKNKSWSSFQNF